MHEETIKGFFSGSVAPEFLNAEALQSITQHDAIFSSIAITDLSDSFSVSRNHLIMLCDAGISGTISETALNAIAFALVATDHFEWDDDIISEVLYDWSAPEINYPLTPFNFSRNKDWLLGLSTPPEKPALQPRGTRKGTIVSQRMKVKDADHV